MILKAQLYQVWIPAGMRTQMLHSRPQRYFSLRSVLPAICYGAGPRPLTAGQTWHSWEGETALNYCADTL